MADPATLAALLRSGEAGAPAMPLGGDPQQAAVTLAALARAGLLNGGPGGMPSANDLLSHFTPAPPSTPPPTPSPARMPTGEQMAGGFMPAPGPPSAYERPGYRPTSGIAMGPQSSQEAMEQAESNRSINPLMEATGFAPMYRSGKALSEGRPLEAAGNAAVATIPYRPVAGLGALGATYGAALGADLLPGMFGTPEANAQANKQGKAPAAVMPGLTPEQQAEYDRARVRVERGQFGSGAERRMLEDTMREMRKVSNDSVTAQNAAKTSLDTQRQSRERAEYDRRVANAERIRDEELGRARRFQDTNVGKVFDATGGYAPLVAGVAAGGLSRLATGGSRPSLYNYALPAAEGGAAGALTYNIPLAYDAFLTPVENPERRAYSAFARELPMNHPEREQWTNYAAGLPEANPVRRNASQEFYDPGRMAERMIVGAGEGILGGIAGSSAIRTGARILPGGRPPAGPSPSSPGPSPQTPPPAGNNPLAGGGPPMPPAAPPPAPRPLPPSAGGPPHEPGVTRYRNPTTGDERFMDARGRWQGPHRGGGHGWISEPPASWERISSAEETAPSSGQTMAEFLRGAA